MELFLSMSCLTYLRSVSTMAVPGPSFREKMPPYLFAQFVKVKYEPLVGIWCRFPRIGIVGGPGGRDFSRLPMNITAYSRNNTRLTAGARIKMGGISVKSPVLSLKYAQYPVAYISESKNIYCTSSHRASAPDAENKLTLSNGRLTVPDQLAADSHRSAAAASPQAKLMGSRALTKRKPRPTPGFRLKASSYELDSVQSKWVSHR